MRLNESLLVNDDFDEITLTFLGQGFDRNTQVFPFSNIFGFNLYPYRSRSLLEFRLLKALAKFFDLNRIFWVHSFSELISGYS